MLEDIFSDQNKQTKKPETTTTKTTSEPALKMLRKYC